MSLNTPAAAQDIIGVLLTQSLLDEAYAMICQYTPYRWVSTTVTKTLSGDNGNYLFLNAPIISVTSLVIDDITLVDGTDFDIRADMGVLRVYGKITFGHDNVVLTYTYGYTDAHSRYAETYPIVKGAEARIALFLKKNPLLMQNIGVTGANLSFPDQTLSRLLEQVPRPFDFSPVVSGVS